MQKDGRNQGLRIHAGRLRGRIIEAPPGQDTRPTASRARETLLQVLTSNYLSQGWMDAIVLDLYAGSGALSFEALSRGALHATCIDQDKRAIQTITANANALKLRDQITIRSLDLQQDAEITLRNAPNIVFCDPPYAVDATSLLTRLHDRVTPRCILCYEHGSDRVPVLFPHWRLLTRKRLGAACISIFIREERDAADL